MQISLTSFLLRIVFNTESKLTPQLVTTIASAQLDTRLKLFSLTVKRSQIGWSFVMRLVYFHFFVLVVGNVVCCCLSDKRVPALKKEKTKRVINNSTTQSSSLQPYRGNQT